MTCLLLLLLLLSRISRVRRCVTSETAAHQAPPSLGFSGREHWSELPFPSPMHESEVAQSCLTLRDPVDCSLPGSSVYGIFQARVLEWVDSLWGHKESDMTEQLHFHFSLSCIGEGNGRPLQCSCLENPRDRGAWWAAVYGVAQSQI